MHIFPDLVRLEAKYPGVLVIIGVHSPKFPHEKKTESIRKAVLRYDIKHPVVNDANLVLWKRYGVNFWPTFVLIDPEGRYYGQTNGEGLFEFLDMHIQKLIQKHKGKGLKETPIDFQMEQRLVKSPLNFPGKIVADAQSDRLFISDSTNNRIVITDLKGKKIAIAGTGAEGKQDGDFAQATFADPQGMAYDGKDTLYVADRKNHVIRALDLKNETVRTVAGTGVQDRFSQKRIGKALAVGLNSPWDLLLHNNILYIAMAGHHQIWIMNLKSGNIGPFAGNGNEELVDGSRLRASFAQPSGLGTDGRNLYVADSEISAIRSMPLNGSGTVKTIVGTGLFKFGDVDGVGDQVRLQHALGVQYLKGYLYVADTYNNKIKIISPVRRICETYLGDQPGTFDEPGGLSIAGDKMYVADTGAHRIRVVDMTTRAVTTLELQGVEAPTQAAPAAVKSGG